MLEWFFVFVFGHCLADTALQPVAMAKGKNRHTPIDLSVVPKGQKPLKLWGMWMTHHSMIHGGVVYLLTGSFLFGVMEATSHWAIDFFKSESKYDPYVDQALHLGMKIVYISMIACGIK